MYLRIIFIIFFTLNAYAELDKNNYSRNEISDFISEFDWKNNFDDPIIVDENAKAIIDLRGFPYVSYLVNVDEVKQMSYWSNGYEDSRSKYYMVVYPSEDQDNNDTITVVFENYIQDGYIDGSDWDNLDTTKTLQDRWERQQQLNNEIIKNGYEPVSNIDWHIEPTFIKNKGYVYQSTKVYYEESGLTYNTWLYLLGRNGYQIVSILFSEKEAKYINDNLINSILDSFQFNEGSAYFDFQEGDNVSSTSASDLVKVEEEKKLILYVDDDVLCIDAISPRDTQFDDYFTGVILGVASGYNTLDFMLEANYGYAGTQEELIKSIADYCKVNPGEPLMISIIKTLSNQL